MLLSQSDHLVDMGVHIDKPSDELTGKEMDDLLELLEKQKGK